MLVALYGGIFRFSGNDVELYPYFAYIVTSIPEKSDKGVFFQTCRKIEKNTYIYVVTLSSLIRVPNKGRDVVKCFIQSSIIKGMKI